MGTGSECANGNSPVNVLAAYLGGLALHGQATAGLAASEMGSLPALRQRSRIAQAPAPQNVVGMEPQQAGLQQQQPDVPNPPPLAAPPMPMRMIPPVARPPNRPLMTSLGEQQHRQRPVNKQPFAQQQQRPVVQNHVR